MQRLISIATWDGVLPVLIAYTPLFTKVIFPQSHIAEVIVAVLLPIAFALIRTQLGSAQLEKVAPGAIQWWRPTLFAGAIILLLIFEMLATMLNFADDEPISAWLAPLGILTAYMAAIWFVLRPAADSTVPATNQHTIDASS